MKHGGGEDPPPELPKKDAGPPGDEEKPIGDRKVESNGLDGLRINNVPPPPDSELKIQVEGEEIKAAV